VCVCSMLASDSRASSLLRGSSASRKLATDRDQSMSLWKNYVVMGCCLATPTHHHHHVATTTAAAASTANEYRCVTPELTAAMSVLMFPLFFLSQIFSLFIYYYF